MDAHHVHDAREVVGQHVQRHLGGNPWQRLHQEVRSSHPGFDRAEGVLDRLAPLAHLLRMLVEPALHRLENVLMLPSGNPSLLASGAAVLDDAALAGGGPVAGPDRSISTRQYARLVSEWVAAIGLDANLFGTHSLRRTKATLIYRRTGNLRAVQLLLGHRKIESTVRYLGIEVDDALAIAEQVDV